jgi:1,6-anhydro-N-acetylmuramate kinase
MDYTLAVGLISGMSIDGIDAALLRVYPDQPFELVALFRRGVKCPFWYCTLG